MIPCEDHDDDKINEHTRLHGLCRLPVALLACLLFLHCHAHAGSLVTDFNTGLPAGTILYGSAYWAPSGGVNDSGMLALTDNVTSQTGYFVIPDLDAGHPITSLVVDFHALIGGGTLPPADGFSFNFADDLPLPPGPLPVEDGLGTGLSVCFDSFDNGGSEAPAIEVRWNGSLVDRVLRPVSRGEAYFPYRIVLDPDGSVDVTTWDQGGGTVPIFANLATGYTPISGGQFAFAARTGALTDKHWIDNVSIQTEPAPTNEAYYSLEGWFANGSETQSILFSLQSPISAANNDPFSLRTWQNGGTGVGETNAAGDVINAGGFDPVLSLYKIESDGSPTLKASNDDHFGLDSQISWGTSGLTELPFGDYRLDLNAYGSTLGGRQRHWAVDLVGKSYDLAHGIGSVTVLSGIDRSGITTLKSLKFGATGNLLGGARVNIASGEALVVSGDFEMRDTGRAVAYVDNGALVADRVHVSPGTGIYLLNGGTVSTSELVVEGILKGTGAVILPETGVLWNRGTIEISDPFGLFSSTITVPSGHYVQESGGVLDIGIGGTGLADYGRLTILNGTAQLEGLLHVITVDSFVPSVGQSYKIITAADGFLTTFEQDHISLPDISGSGLGWDVAYRYGPDGWSMVLTTFALGAGSSSGAEYAVPEPSSLTLMALAGAIGLVCRSLRRIGRHLGMVMLLFVSTTPAGAGEVYWSFEGWFADGSETQSFFFDVPYSDITPSDPFSLRTWQNGGGYNAAGDYVVPDGFDPVVGLFDGADNLVVANDDRYGLDSGIGWGTPSCTWGQFPSCAGTWNPTSLPPDNYRLDLAAYGWNLQNRQSHWAVDLVGPVGDMWLTGVGHNGVSTLKSLKFGTADPSFVAGAEIGNGQSLVMSGDLVVGENAVMNNAGVIAAGRVEVKDSGWLMLDDGTVSTREMVVNFALEGTGDVILSANGSLQNHGTVQPGHWWYTSQQTLTGEGGAITIPRGNYEQTERFRIYIGGRSPTQYGQLHVFDGSASLGGLLLVGLVDVGGGTYFAPVLGDAFEILTAAGGFQGTKFDDFDYSEAPLAAGLKWNVRYTPTSVVLEVVNTLLGDYNQNGVVDAEDYTVWRDNLGANIALPNEDPAQTPGSVTPEDYDVWKLHFGETAPGNSARAIAGVPGTGEAAVPEPASFLLCVFAAAWMLIHRLARPTAEQGHWEVAIWVALLLLWFPRSPAVLAQCEGPTIESQPQSQTVSVGCDVRFFVEVTGTEPLAYQWRKDGTPIPGAVDPSLSIFGVQLGDAGDYGVCERQPVWCGHE